MSTTKIPWACPRCRKSYLVAPTHRMTVCPDCNPGLPAGSASSMPVSAPLSPYQPATIGAAMDPFTRYVFNCALACGCGAFVGWIIVELTYPDSPSLISTAVLGAILGSMICGGMAVFTTMANGSITQIPRKVGFALFGGMIGGGIAFFAAQILYQNLRLRFVAWMLAGVGVGMVDGLFERSRTKIRNGFIGGAAGGMLGGLLFDPIAEFIRSNVPSRAIGFVIVGLCIGAFIGLVQVILKQAWVVVVEGYRPGRQLILSMPTTILGRGDYLPLPFLGQSSTDIEREHLRLIHQPNGSYLIEDNNSRLGTFVNGQRISGPTPLKHKDRIRFGSNYVEFNESRSADSGLACTTQPVSTEFIPVTPRPPLPIAPTGSTKLLEPAMAPQRAPAPTVKLPPPPPLSPPRPK